MADVAEGSDGAEIEVVKRASKSGELWLNVACRCALSPSFVLFLMTSCFSSSILLLVVLSPLGPPGEPLR